MGIVSSKLNRGPNSTEMNAEEGETANGKSEGLKEVANVDLKGEIVANGGSPPRKRKKVLTSAGIEASVGTSIEAEPLESAGSVKSPVDGPPSETLVATTGGSLTRPANETPRSTRKRKLAVIVGYDGAPFHGFQRNKDVRTITDELEEAFHKAGLISDVNFTHLKKISWVAAARTDKGVSAAGNCVSFKAEISKEEGADSPDGLRKLIPKINAILPKEVCVFRVSKVSNSFSARYNCGERNYEYLLDSSIINGDIDKLNKILAKYQGSHFFHNYTTGAPHSIPPKDTARRLMHKVYVNPAENFTLPNDESNKPWVRVRIRGQSFMLHQIRKMVAMAILVHTGRVPADAIEKSFEPGCLLNVPPAPSTGLFLDSCDFTLYNRRQNHLEQPVSHLDVEEDREVFKKEIILPSIAKRVRERNDMEIFFRVVEEHCANFEQMQENINKPPNHGPLPPIRENPEEVG